MGDRRVLRSRARGRRMVTCRSCEEDETDTSTASDQNNEPTTTGRQSKSKCRGGYCSDSATYNHRRQQRLPPIGVFWDIENCQVPRGKSASAVAQVIREEFFSGYEENEFMVACDANRESPQVVKELNDAQVCVVHVPSQSKNAADEKLRHGMRKFALTHGSCAAMVLISGDVNFAPDLNDIKHRHKIHVILVHNENCSESLMMCANEHYLYSEMVASLPMRNFVNTNQQSEVTVSGLPLNHDAGKVKARLRRLAENCGGRVGLVQGSQATVQFSSLEYGIRAQKRMNGEDVFGNQIVVSHPTVVANPQQLSHYSPTKTCNRKSAINGYRTEDRRVPYAMDQRSFMKPIPPFNNSTNHVNIGVFKKPLPVRTILTKENVPDFANSKFNQPLWGSTLSKQQCPPVGIPILGRQNSANPPYESRISEGYSNGRHSLDSMLDFDPEREVREEREKQSNAVFENWLRNSTSNLDKKCPIAVLGIDTSIPPPPIVNVPKRSEKYFFNPIDKLSGPPQSSPSPSSSNDASEPLRCLIHSRSHHDDSSLANVTVRLSDFSARLMALVTSHDNRIPLASLRDCYEAQFGVMVADSCSVSLEHLVTCVRSLELVKSPGGGGKYLQLTTNISPTGISLSDPPKMAENVKLIQLSKDLQNMLINQPRCQLAFDHVISAYNRTYGKLCRMSDYGCTKLAQLLEKLPNVQVMGEKVDRVVTLAHRAQMQRFTSDLTLVLRSAPGKQLTIHQLPQAWLSTLGCALEPTQYGLCYLQDLLDLVPACSVAASGETISLPPSSQQTAAQAKRTERFVPQVIEMLEQVSNFTMEFSKFCPAYHKHFGVQCKLADYGFTKLIELFEAIPHIVNIEGDMETGRRISLTQQQRLKVLSGRVLSLVQTKYPPGLGVDTLVCDYLWKYGHALRPEHYHAGSPLELLTKLDTVEVLKNLEGKPIVVPAIDAQGATGKAQQSCPPKEVKDQSVNSKRNGVVTSSSVALLDLMKKAQYSSPVENGASSTELYNKLKPLASEQTQQVKLLSPAEFLRPPPLSKSPNTTSASIFPSSPDPSMLPNPIGLTLSKAPNLFNVGVNLLENIALPDQNQHTERVKLAPQFCSPLQLN